MNEVLSQLAVRTRTLLKPFKRPFLIQPFRTSSWPILLSSLIMTGLVTGLKHVGLLEVAELAVYDFSVRRRPDLPLDPRITLLSITEEDCARYTCPLTDQFLANALSALQVHSPRVIGLDIYRPVPQGPGQATLAEQLRADNLIAIRFVSSSAQAGGDIPAPPEVGLEQVGFSDIFVDRDGVIRRNSLFFGAPEAESQSFALKVAQTYLGKDKYPFSFTQGETLRIGGIEFPNLNAYSGGYHNIYIRGHQILLRYRNRSQASLELTLGQLLDGTLDPGHIQDKIVLIGKATEVSNNTSFFTPYSLNQEGSLNTAGTIIHAHIVSQILDHASGQAALYRFLPPWTEVLWLWGWCLVGSFLVWRIKQVWRLWLVGALAMVGLVGGGIGAIAHLLWMPVVEPCLGLLGTVALADRLKSRPASLILRERSIFISYRRSDSQNITRKIYDQLAKHFGREKVFRDLDSIPAGATFKEYIENELSQCQILIAVIGPTWLQVTNQGGQRRIDNPQDWVRLEIEFALERGIHLIPLLINDTPMPEVDDLPGLLKDLPTRHAARIKHVFRLNRNDVAGLINDIEGLL